MEIENKLTAKNSLNEANEAVQSDREQRIRFKLKTWELIQIAINEFGILEVSKALKMPVPFIRGRLKALQNHLSNNGASSKACLQNRSTKPIVIEDGFAVLDLSNQIYQSDQSSLNNGSCRNDFKAEIKIGGINLSLEGDSRSFSWTRLFEGIQGGIRC